MKYSVIKEIMRYQTVGQPMSRPPVTVDETTFLFFSVGGGVYVWRTADQFSIEVGRRGGGGTYYCKVKGHVIEETFDTLRSAGQAGVEALKLFQGPSPIAFRANAMPVVH